MKSRKEMLIEVLHATAFMVSIWALAMWCAYVLASGAI